MSSKATERTVSATTIHYSTCWPDVEPGNAELSDQPGSSFHAIAPGWSTQYKRAPLVE